MEGPIRPPSDPEFRLIETFLWTPDQGVCRREGHFARLHKSAARLGVAPQVAEAAMGAISGASPLRVRLTVDAGGAVEVTTHPYTPLPQSTVWTLKLAEERLDSSNPWLGMKTTERALYDRARCALPEGIDEFVFLNERDELCEGTITNLFVDTGQGLLTPPLHCGLLPGVLRQEIIEAGQAREAELEVSDLRSARAIFVGNSLRGLIRARLVFDDPSRETLQR